MSYSDTILILIDEKGDPGSTEKSTKEFTMTASIISDSDALKRIVDSTEKGTRYPNDPRMKNELKYWSSSDLIRTSVISKLREVNPIVYAVHIKKSEIEKGTSSKSTYTTVTRDLIKEVMKNEILRDRDVVVIFDETNHLEERKARDIVMDAANNNDVFGLKRDNIRKESSKNNKLLQAHDFLAGAIGSKYIDGQTADFEIIADITMVYSSHSRKRNRMAGGSA